jgi:hypothetical protein
LLSLYSPQAQLRIFTYLYEILQDDQNDRGLSLLTTLYYKPLADRSLLGAYLSHAKSFLFDVLLDALKDGSKNQGDLQEAVFGSSGRGNSSFKTLFELMGQRGFLKATKKGRSTIYSLA